MVRGRRPSDQTRAAVPARVCFVLHKFDRGGSLRVAAYLARGLTDLGMNVELIMFTHRGEVDKIIIELAGADIPIRYLGSWSGPRALDLVQFQPQRHHATVVHAQRWHRASADDP